MLIERKLPKKHMLILLVMHADNDDDDDDGVSTWQRPLHPNVDTFTHLLHNVSHDYELKWKTWFWGDKKMLYDSMNIHDMLCG